MFILCVLISALIAIAFTGALSALITSADYMKVILSNYFEYGSFDAAMRHTGYQFHCQLAGSIFYNCRDNYYDLERLQFSRVVAFVISLLITKRLIFNRIKY